jgi:hypothetical protein
MFSHQLHKVGRFQFFFDRSNYAVAPSGTATVAVFIRETFNPRNDESLLVSKTDGLISAGVVVQVSAPLPSHPAFVRAPTAILGNTAFDLAVVVKVPTPRQPESAGLIALSTKPVFGNVVSRSPTCESVLLPLGTFTFTAGEVPGEVTFLNAVVPEDFSDRASANNVTQSGVNLDPWLRPGCAMIVVSTKVREPKKTGRVASVSEELAGMYIHASDITEMPGPARGRSRYR